MERVEMLTRQGGVVYVTPDSVDHWRDIGGYRLADAPAPSVGFAAPSDDEPMDGEDSAPVDTPVEPAEVEPIEPEDTPVKRPRGRPRKNAS